MSKAPNGADRAKGIPRRPPRASMQPRFTLYVLYLGVLFVGFALVLILPELLEVYEQIPPGREPTPEDEARLQEVARSAASGRLLPAFALAFTTLALGAYYQVLPGIRGPG